jgi:hypothetical protein
VVGLGTFAVFRLRDLAQRGGVLDLAFLPPRVDSLQVEFVLALVPLALLLSPAGAGQRALALRHRALW